MFNPDTVSKFTQWTNDQFADYYTPNPKHVDAYVQRVLQEFVHYFDMDPQISWEELRRDYHFEDSFNDCFMD